MVIPRIRSGIEQESNTSYFRSTFPKNRRYKPLFGSPKPQDFVLFCRAPSRCRSPVREPPTGYEPGFSAWASPARTSLLTCSYQPHYLTSLSLFHSHPQFPEVRCPTWLPTRRSYSPSLKASLTTERDVKI